MNLKAFLDKGKNCQFCRIARAAIIFALGFTVGLGFESVQELLARLN